MQYLDTETFLHPYYIIAPRYARTSAGVRVLYRLADLINKGGGSAYVFLWPSFNWDSASSPCDIAPFLTKRVVDHHFSSGLTPIVIYPEVFDVSRFNAPVRVRYVLNYDGLFVANDSFQLDDYVLAYSHEIASRIGTSTPRGELFLPVSDVNFFVPPPDNVRRTGGAFYAGKYKYRFGGVTFPVTDGLIEITRDRPDSQTPEQIRDIFQKIDLFYCYEDTALALEAILCGCPVVFLPNEYFCAPLGAKELSFLGFAWGDSPEQIDHARRTVATAREEHLKRLSEIREKIRKFMDETQKIADSRPYPTPFANGVLRRAGFLRRSLDLGAFLRDVIADRGVGGTIKTIAKRLRAGRLSI